MKGEDPMRLKFDEVRVFCERVFRAFGFSDADSRTVTDVLLAADLAGITSHGVQRLVRYHKEINCNGLVGERQRRAAHQPITSQFDFVIAL